GQEQDRRVADRRKDVGGGEEELCESVRRPARGCSRRCHGGGSHGSVGKPYPNDSALIGHHIALVRLRGGNSGIDPEVLIGRRSYRPVGVREHGRRKITRGGV